LKIIQPIGFKGTHSDINMYEKYFRNIKLNLNSYSPLGVSKEDFSISITKGHSLDYLSNYEVFFDHLLKNGVQVHSLKEILGMKDKIIKIFYDQGQPIENNWNLISNYFKIWHSIPIRTEYEGVVTLRWAENWLFLIRNTSPKYRNEPLMDMSEFKTSVPLWIRNDKQSNLNVFIGKNTGESCDYICRQQSSNSICNVQYTSHQLNNCIMLKKYFPCESCDGSMGLEQPAFVQKDKRCLFNLPSNHYQTSCHGSHKDTIRLCACYDPTKTISEIEKEWDEMIHPSE
jgi:hypothetical protein